VKLLILQQKTAERSALMRDLRAVLRLVWLFLTLAGASAIAVSLLVPEPVFARVVPVCPSKRIAGRPCILCGSTTAFLAIGRGDWKAAARSNRLAIAIWWIFALNTLVAGWYWLRLIRTR
jgi:hypothetical protein